MNQSINQTMDDAINQSINRPINQSIDRPKEQTITESNHKLMNQTINESTQTANHAKTVQQTHAKKQPTYESHYHPAINSNDGPALRPAHRVPWRGESHNDPAGAAFSLWLQSATGDHDIPVTSTNWHCHCSIFRPLRMVHGRAPSPLPVRGSPMALLVTAAAVCFRRRRRREWCWRWVGPWKRRSAHRWSVCPPDVGPRTFPLSPHPLNALAKLPRKSIYWIAKFFKHQYVRVCTSMLSDLQVFFILLILNKNFTN